MGVPVYGSKSLREELANPMPAPEILGVVDTKLTDPTPKQESASWTGTSGEMEMVEPPPPWEVSSEFDASNARLYVDVPKNWTLRWINPRLLETQGWRHWQPVMASDPRVNCRVSQMVGPDNNIRRGGAVGDILAWMYTSWVESRRALLQKKTDAQTSAAYNKQETLREEFRRGTYGPNVRLEESRHPTHTILEGRSIPKD